MGASTSFPILMTPDLGRLQSFYAGAFGAERTYAYTAGGRDVYVALRIGDSQLGIALDEDLHTEPVGVALWIYVDDVDTSYGGAIEAGATSIAEPDLMPWGERVAQVRDPGGFIVHLGAESS